MAPTAAVISRALVASNAKTYFEKSSCARPGTLPSALAAVRPWTAPSDTWPTPRTMITPNSRPTTVAISRWPRIVSTTESDASTPTSISTNRNSIKIAPV